MPLEKRTNNLTPRQQAILQFIEEHTGEHGYPPTLREIGFRFGIRSTNGVNDHLIALEKKGVLIRGSSKSRALRPVTTRRHESIEVPLLGRVAAGQPILATENLEETVSMDPGLLGNAAQHQLFALRVRGDSMIGAGIFDGDVVFVRRQEIAESGQIVVAMLSDEATVKRYQRDGDSVRLLPENPRMEPIVVGPAELPDLRILGVAVGVYRKL